MPTETKRIVFCNHQKAPEYPNIEWIVTNGLGGYASMGVSGCTTRKYHGLLVAALPSPLGRTVMLNFVRETIQTAEKSYVLTEEEQASNKEIFHAPFLTSFVLNGGLPCWTYQLTPEISIEKKIFLGHMQNTVHLIYEYTAGREESIKFLFEPYFEFRHHEAAVSGIHCENYAFSAHNNYFEINACDLPPLYIVPSASVQMNPTKHKLENVYYRLEEERGYASVGALASPGSFVVTLKKNEPFSFIVSTEHLDMLQAMTSEEAYEAEKARRHLLLSAAIDTHAQIATSSFALELVLAADQFITIPYTRLTDVVWTRAIGEDARTIIAGYHWFNDWGRDTMISLEGLTLVTGRFNDAKYILQTFMHHLRQGLIPNMFPDRDCEGIYNTADATLWFFHALDRYLHYTQDQDFIKQLLPKINEIIDCHLKGTLFGIHVDEDGLLIQGQAGYALTWMDAKMGDQIMTPRRGKAVEICALWYNALKLASEWMTLLEEKDRGAFIQTIADRCYRSFNQKFWCEEKKYLYDIVEGENGHDHACRPNQLFAISLKYPVLDPTRWESVLQAVQQKLLSPYGLKTLSAENHDYKVAYLGDLQKRDEAYHQGTIWAWLIGPFVDAWLKQYPEDKKSAHAFLEGFEKHFSEGGVGTINEIFDAEHPFIHRGCIAQAWSVAEILRTWVKTM